MTPERFVDTNVVPYAAANPANAWKREVALRTLTDCELVVSVQVLQERRAPASARRSHLHRTDRPPLRSDDRPGTARSPLARRRANRAEPVPYLQGRQRHGTLHQSLR